MVSMAAKLSAPSINLIRSDPLSNVLVHKLKMTPVTIAIVMFIIACIWRLIIPLSSSKFLQSPMNFPPSLDGTILSFVEVPFFWGYFLWSKEQLATLFISVLDNKLLNVEMDKKRYKGFVNDIAFVFSMKRIYLFTAFIALMLTAVQVFYFFPGNPDIWYEPYIHPLYAFGEMLTYPLSQYIVVTLILTGLIVIVKLNFLFRNYHIKVHLDFPDRAGGWGEIGRHALGISFFAIIFGIWLIGLTISVEAQYTFPILVKAFFWFSFSLLAPIGFAAPILSAHWAMRKYKIMVLREVSKYINSLFTDSKKKFSLPEFYQKGLVNQFNNLGEWYAYLDKSMPTWPFPRASFPVIASTWLLPVISGLITSYIQDYLKKVFP